MTGHLVKRAAQYKLPSLSEMNRGGIMSRSQGVSVRKIKELLRLESLGLSHRSIARSVKLSRWTVSEYLKRSASAGLSWEKVQTSSEEAVSNLFEKHHQSKVRNRREPEYAYMHKELKRRGVTLQLLWEEYIEQDPGGYSYSNYVLLYRKWRNQNKLVLRKNHTPGKNMSVDYAGMTMPIYDRRSGEITEVEIFVACLEASNYTFAKAYFDQKLFNWLEGHKDAFDYFGGVTEVVIPDNLKSGVTKSCYYEPDINPSYQDFATHYGIAVIPTRVRKPRDKGKVEKSVQVVERRILAPLRNRKFFSIEELNQAISAKLKELNDRPMQEYNCSRRDLFEQTEQEMLRPLPVTEYIFKEVRKAKVNIDYHVAFEKSFYSVPYTLIHSHVELHISNKLVEIYHNGKRVACHTRSHKIHDYNTLKEHMPEAHQAVTERRIDKLLEEAANIGPETEKQVTSVINSRRHPEQGFRASLGILRLANKHSPEKVESACKLANDAKSASYKTITNILRTGEPPEILPPRKSFEHTDVRGRNYYH